jgi:hypothetical protein
VLNVRLNDPILPRERENGPTPAESLHSGTLLECARNPVISTPDEL